MRKTRKTHKKLSKTLFFDKGISIITEMQILSHFASEVLTLDIVFPFIWARLRYKKKVNKVESVRLAPGFLINKEKI